MRGNFVKGGYELWSEKLLNFYCYSCLVFCLFCFLFFPAGWWLWWHWDDTVDWSLQETAHCHPATDCHWHHSWGPAAKTVSSTCGRLGSPQHGELLPHCHLSALGDLIPRMRYCYHSLLPRLTIKNVADLVHICMMSCCLAATSLLDLSLYWPGLEFTFKDLLPTLSVHHGDCQHRVWQLVSCYITAPSLLNFLSLPARFEVNLWGFVAQTDSSKCGRPGTPSYGECCTTGTATSLLYLCLYWPGLKFTFWGFVANTLSSVLILLAQSVSDLVLLSMMSCCVTVISLLGTSLLVFSDQV